MAETTTEELLRERQATIAKLRLEVAELMESNRRLAAIYRDRGVTIAAMRRLLNETN